MTITLRPEQEQLVLDIMRTGGYENAEEAIESALEMLGSQNEWLIESRGGVVVGLAVIVYQPTPKTPDFSPLPLYYLAKLDEMYFTDAPACDVRFPHAEVTKVWI